MSYPRWLPLALAGALYVWQAWEYHRLMKPGEALAFIGYAIANIGFIWAIIRSE